MWLLGSEMRRAVRGDGIMEYWSIGVLEYWSAGVMEWWSIWLDWNSGFDDAEAVRDKGAIG
jgi:hypothetical protein